MNLRHRPAMSPASRHLGPLVNAFEASLADPTRRCSGRNISAEQFGQAARHLDT